MYFYSRKAQKRYALLSSATHTRHVVYNSISKHDTAYLLFTVESVEKKNVIWLLMLNYDVEN